MFGCRHVTRAESRGHDTARAAVRLGDKPGFVGRNDGEIHTVQERRFFGEHAGEIAESLEVLLLHAGDHRDVGRDDGAQQRDLTWHVGAHLDHRAVGPRRE